MGSELGRTGLRAPAPLASIQTLLDAQDSFDLAMDVQSRQHDGLAVNPPLASKLKR